MIVINKETNSTQKLEFYATLRLGSAIGSLKSFTFRAADNSGDKGEGLLAGVKQLQGGGGGGGGAVVGLGRGLWHQMVEEERFKHLA